MAYRLITCPESAHVELIEYADTPCGMLILGCTAFQPTCEVSCPRTCAMRLDQLGRDDDPDPDDSVLAVGDDTSIDVLGRLRA